MKRLSIVFVVLFLSTAALTQMADASFTIGGSFVSDLKQSTPPVNTSFVNTVNFDHHLMLEGAVSFRMLNAHVVSLYLEVPAAGIPSQTLTGAPQISNVSGFVARMSSLFVTPGFKLKVLPTAPISPWASVGAGWARYSLVDFPGTVNKGALQYGGGLDFKTGLPLLGFRVEVRDFVTTDPSSLLGPTFTPQSGLHHHNLLVGGGVVLRF
ncbi:MAG TPA: hypothetical protein VJV96_15610 [Candidatus Angelobacter sp.]|jgi:hypothetical protein|nr:hypothetical protein [Candidatus Angelobacter sp.]